MKRIDDFFGPLGFLFHLDDKGLPEYGDGASRLGLYWLPQLVGYKRWDLKAVPFLTRYKMLFTWPPEPTRYPGIPIRTPESHEWYSRPGTMSRDNMVPCLACLTILGKTDFDLLIKILKRGGFLWNTKKIGQHSNEWKIPDWVGLSVLALFVRALINSKGTWGHLLLYITTLPLLLTADAFLVLSVIVRLISLKIDADNCGDCINKVCLLASIKESKTETLLSLFARVLYSGLHPGAGPNNRARKQGFGPLTSFEHYFNGDRNPPIDQIWKDYLLKRF